MKNIPEVTLCGRFTILINYSSETLFFKMLSVIEEPTKRVNEATESLRRAEERLHAYMDTNPTDFTSAGFLIRRSHCL